MKLLGSSKSKITKDGNGYNVPPLELTEVVIVLVILSTMVINIIQQSCRNLFLMNQLVNY